MESRILTRRTTEGLGTCRNEERWLAGFREDFSSPVSSLDLHPYICLRVELIKLKTRATESEGAEIGGEEQKGRKMEKDAPSAKGEVGKQQSTTRSPFALSSPSSPPPLHPSPFSHLLFRWQLVEHPRGSRMDLPPRLINLQNQRNPRRQSDALLLPSLPWMRARRRSSGAGQRG